MSDVEWQIRNWYNFTWLCGDGLVEQAVHTVDKVAWVMKDQPPVSCVAVGGRRFRRTAATSTTTSRSTTSTRTAFARSWRSGRSTGCYNENSDYILGTKGTLMIGAGQPAHRDAGGRSSGRSRARSIRHVPGRARRAVPVDSRRQADQRRRTWRPARCWPSWAAWRPTTGQQVTWEQALNSEVSLVPKPIDWKGNHEAPALALPGQSKVV